MTDFKTFKIEKVDETVEMTTTVKQTLSTEQIIQMAKEFQNTVLVLERKIAELPQTKVELEKQIPLKTERLEKTGLTFYEIMHSIERELSYKDPQFKDEVLKMLIDGKTRIDERASKT